MFRNCRIAAKGVDAVAYHGAQQAKRGAGEFVMSSSALRQFAFCPSKWIAGHEKPDTASTLYGQLFDTLVLTPSLYDKRYVTKPSTYPKRVLRCPQCGSITESKTCRACKIDRVEATVDEEWQPKSETCQKMIEAWEKEGKTVIDADGSDKFPGLKQAQEAKARLFADPICRAFLECCEVQVHVVGEWVDEWEDLSGKRGTGLIVPVQCLIDLAPRSDSLYSACLGDLKTTRSAYPPFFDLDVRSLGYDIQAAWDLDMHNAATGEKRDRWTWILSENTFPFEPGRCFARETEKDDADLGPGKIDDGRQIYQANMAFYCECLAKGEWPGYCDGPESVNGFVEIRHNEYKDGPAVERAQRRIPAPASAKDEDYQGDRDDIPT